MIPTDKYTLVYISTGIIVHPSTCGPDADLGIYGREDARTVLARGLHGNHLGPQLVQGSAQGGD